MDMTNEDELREQLNEEMAKFEEEGYFKRLGKMFSGLGRPRDSREYKEALIELQRQVAPLSAILLPLIVVIVLFVVTAVGGGPKKEIKLDIVQADQDDQLEEIKPPEEVEPPPDLDVEIQVDTPTVGNPTEVAEAPAQSAEPQSVQVATVDAMLNVKSPVMMKSVFGAERSTGVRGQLTRGGAQYGDPTTEAAVMKALRWLKVNQHSDGSWPTVKPAATGLAILTYLAHGETPSSKEFGDTVQRGLNYLLGCVHEDGSGTPHVRDGDGNEYAFLIATYALCETYGMTKNPDAREVAEKCLERIVKNQSATGGWDYKLNKGSTRDDMSFAGWALQALKAGKMAGIHISGLDECIKKAVKCLKTRNFSKGGFNYTAGGDPTGLTATGCLAMQLLGYMNETEVKAALDTMRTWLPSFDPAPRGTKLNEGLPGACPQYYCYYAAQCKYQAGMCKGATPGNFTTWKKWNAAMKALYPKAIIEDKKPDGTPVTVKDPKGKDCPVGHWQNKDAHSMHPQWVMDTCLCALQLMVYYRYLPTTSLKATEVEADVEALSKDKGGEVKVTIDI